MKETNGKIVKDHHVAEFINQWKYFLTLEASISFAMDL